MRTINCLLLKVKVMSIPEVEVLQQTLFAPSILCEICLGEQIGCDFKLKHSKNQKRLLGLGLGRYWGILCLEVSRTLKATRSLLALKCRVQVGVWVCGVSWGILKFELSRTCGPWNLTTPSGSVGAYCANNGSSWLGNISLGTEGSITVTRQTIVREERTTNRNPRFTCCL